MNDKAQTADLWDRTKAWADKNRTISGALVGGAAGTILPVIGTAIGAILGAGIGFASSKEGKTVVEKIRGPGRQRAGSTGAQNRDTQKAEKGPAPNGAGPSTARVGAVDAQG